MQTPEKQAMEHHRKLYYSFCPGMLVGALAGLLLGTAFTYALYFGWLPLAQVGQFFASGIYPALIASAGIGLSLGAFLGALGSWKKE